MISETYNKFVKDSEEKSFDKEHRRKLDFNISKYDTAVIKGKQQYKNLELAKKEQEILNTGL